MNLWLGGQVQIDSPQPEIHLVDTPQWENLLIKVHLLGRVLAPKFLVRAHLLDLKEALLDITMSHLPKTTETNPQREAQDREKGLHLPPKELPNMTPSSPTARSTQILWGTPRSQTGNQRSMELWLLTKIPKSTRIILPKRSKLWDNWIKTRSSTSRTSTRSMARLSKLRKTRRLLLIRTCQWYTKMRPNGSTILSTKKMFIRIKTEMGRIQINYIIET